MKPYVHAKRSAHKWGGVPEDYMPIHDFFDSTKMCHPDMRHRAILHNAFGIYLAERLFGTYIYNSAGKKVQVRDVGEQHVIDDVGFIPTVTQCIGDIDIRNKKWLGGVKPVRAKKIVLNVD